MRKGTYILIFDMPDAKIEVGALGIVDFPKGTYCYVGSAMNGLDHRIERHLSKKKKIHWHIDHLTVVCDSIAAYEATEPATECELGMVVQQNGGIGFAEGFGCSDCKCRTHLFLLTGNAKEKLCSSPCFTLHGEQFSRA